MAAQTRIKVDTQKLIEAIKLRRIEVVEEHRKAIAAHPDLLAKWKKDALARLEKAKASIEKGKEPSFGYSSEYYINAAPSLPVLQTERYDRDIAALGMTSDLVITITADDFGRYLR